MEKYLEKSLKRFLKRKVKITLGFVVSFMITGVVSFGADIDKADYPLMNDKIGNIGYISAIENVTELGTGVISAGENKIYVEIEKTANKTIIKNKKDNSKVIVEIDNSLISTKTAETISTALKGMNGTNENGINNGILGVTQEGQKIENNGIITWAGGQIGQKGTGENAEVINNGILVGSSNAQKAEKGTLVNNGVIITTGTGNAQIGETAKNYGVISANGAGQAGTSTYNYGLIKGATGQAIDGGIGENYGIIISSKIGQQSNSRDSKVYNYGTIDSSGQGMKHSQNSFLYNYGLIKVTTDYGMTNHASSTGETINRGVIHSSDNSSIFGDGNKKIENTGIVITDNQDVYSKDWAKTGVTLNEKYELQNKDTGVAITGDTLNNSSFGNKNIGYIHTNDKNSSLGISNVTADRDEKGDIVNRKVLGVVAEQKSTVFTAKENLLLDGIDMTGYLINGGTFIDMNDKDLVLSDVNITVTEDLTKTNGEKAVAVDLGTGNNSTVKYLIDEKGLDTSNLSTKKYSFGEGVNYKDSPIFNISSIKGDGVNISVKTASEMGLSGQDRIVYDAYIDQVKVGTANKDVIGQINEMKNSEQFTSLIKRTSVTGKAYYTAGSVVTMDIADTYLSSVEDFTKRAGKGEWLAQGKYINSDTEFNGGNKVKGYDGDVTGTVGMIEYGFTDNTSYGAVFGMGDSKIDINGGGKLDGDNTYAGLYMKHKTQNGIDLVANLGYIKNDMDSVLRNDFKFTGDGVSSNGKTFEKGTADSSAVILSVKGKKDYRITDTVKVQPILGARATFINQEEAENPEMHFTIKEQDIIVVEGTAGMGVAKEFILPQGKLELNAGVEYTFAVTSSTNDAEYTLFDKTTVKLEEVDTAENTGTAFVGFDYETEIGLGVNGKYEMMWSDKGDDSRVTAGISYRF